MHCSSKEPSQVENQHGDPRVSLLERRRNDIDGTADRKLRASVIRANSATRALMSSSAFRAEDSSDAQRFRCDTDGLDTALLLLFRSF